MVTVTLAKYWSPEDVLLPPGSVVEVDDETAGWLDSCGAVRHEADNTAKTESKPTLVEQEAEKPAAAAKGGDVPRPAKAAPIDDWRKYAEAQGIVTKGLSKKELIGATQ
ncbi:hypothetical protein GWP26_02370 [Corynebacterium macginleyi]|uniref:hypothetical protein n=1 Tax=Corynebacterium macginleyi TaxID=38290 RepID=UPI0019094BA0|nr:hypothetical protein [Corynebacterium macginleyi]MBK4141184.1 hypothetical protein [Corynebacterium macginleyi]MBK4179770.1 hypothetical protein [Corynebacterium macginleyi]QRJ57462.1 hypothetical protein GWO64_009405 [Corynebacterium macginleyi]